MLIRVKMAGSGVEGDPFRAGVPTYNQLPIDGGPNTMVVEVPDSDVLPGMDTMPGSAVTVVAGAHVLTTLTGPNHGRWHAFLDARYQEHHGEFRPQVQ